MVPAVDGAQFVHSVSLSSRLSTGRDERLRLSALMFYMNTCSTARSPLDRLGDDLSQLGQTAAVERGPSGAGDRISALLTARAQVEALLLDEVAAFDASGAYVEAGTPTAASWLRASGRLGRRDASGTVHQARELRDLTATSEALRAGSISRAHAIEIVKAKERSCLDAESFRRYEEILVELATHATPDEVRAAVGHLVEAEAEAPDRDKELLDALADRSLTLRQVGDLVKVDAMIDKVTAAALSTGVEALSRRTPATTAAGTYAAPTRSARS